MKSGYAMRTVWEDQAVKILIRFDQGCHQLERSGGMDIVIHVSVN